MFSDEEKSPEDIVKWDFQDGIYSPGAGFLDIWVVHRFIKLNQAIRLV
jgi:hypothetical protein